MTANGPNGDVEDFGEATDAVGEGVGAGVGELPADEAADWGSTQPARQTTTPIRAANRMA